MKINKNAYIKKVPNQLNHFVDFIHNRYPRPNEIAKNLKTRKIQHSVFAEPVSYPYRWATDTFVFRSSIN